MNTSRRTVLWTLAAVTGGALAIARLPARAAKRSGRFEIEKTPAEWREILTPEQYRVLREHGTERAGSSPLDNEKRAGVYRCAGCQLPVFSSTTKYDSGTGWPSFYAPLKGAIGTSIESGFFGDNTEVHCRRCGGHLGHVFDDGPKPTGLRYCMNGVALTFVPAAQRTPA
ncbi:MAG TPA: peptide-methionine (R)-S-oxide reductase MsrB [Steroidobacteraceae bacterium]|nr:peptide-methionine (R)-S-oxide reductase MsrB [Steroidobacteraceae bacterium]HRX89954.1 peptide-methionine (R)-S-oxide reductase MsrB [Steroidobacteraceae bacterium]